MHALWAECGHAAQSISPRSQLSKLGTCLQAAHHHADGAPAKAFATPVVPQVRIHRQHGCMRMHSVAMDMP